MVDFDPTHWPAWRYSAECPDGEIFQHPDDVPDGWFDTPAKIHATETRPRLTPLPNWDKDDEQPRRGRPPKVK